VTLLSQRLRRLVRCRLRSLGSAEEGATAIEFAVLGSLFVVLLLNVVDCSLLIWSQMEVNYAAEVGAQAAFKSCSMGSIPATTYCPTMSGTVTAAVQSTALGNAVSLASGSPAEGFYCTTSNSSLQSVGTYDAPPSPYTCSATGDPTTRPSDYVTVSVNYGFQPLFSGLSYVQAQALSGSSMQRLQ
jgi:Flp pilus assembly protein TadG